MPAETKLVKMARARNIQVIPGLEMFVQQGARQFEIWTGKPAPIAEMSFCGEQGTGANGEPDQAKKSQPAQAQRLEARGEASTLATRPAKTGEPESSPGKKKAKAVAQETREKSGQKASQALSFSASSALSCTAQFQPSMSSHNRKSI